MHTITIHCPQNHPVIVPTEPGWAGDKVSTVTRSAGDDIHECRTCGWFRRLPDGSARPLDTPGAQHLRREEAEVMCTLQKIARARFAEPERRTMADDNRLAQFLEQYRAQYANRVDFDLIVERVVDSEELDAPTLG